MAWPTQNVTVSETITVTAGGTGGAAFTQGVNCTSTLVCGGSVAVSVLTGDCGNTAVVVTYSGTCFGVTHQPTGEEKWCTNTSSTVGLQQVIGSSTLPLSISGPGTSFTIPLFGGASTCYVQLTQNGTPCGLPAQAGTTICSDGYIVVSLSSPGSSAVISCAGGATPAGQAFFSTSTTTGATTPLFPGLFFTPNGGTCVQQTSGTTLLIPCGATATTNGSVPSVSSFTCAGGFFDIASFLSGCLGGQTIVQACPLGSNAYTLTGGTATVTISFQSTAFNGGINGGFVLGTNSFTFQAPSVGTLLVTATPQLIPSNGTLASVITATFACGSGFSLTNQGFPLSAFFGNNITQTNATFAINQPILGGGSAVCGGGLPGTFTFATPGEVLFDNGRTSESVGCGLNGQQNIFGGSSLFNPNNLNPTLPLTFTCTGAAVLAIGGGAAGDAPINVTYASSVGGLTAVGSTLITVAPIRRAAHLGRLQPVHHRRGQHRLALHGDGHGPERDAAHRLSGRDGDLDGLGHDGGADPALHRQRGRLPQHHDLPERHPADHPQHPLQPAVRVHPRPVGDLPQRADHRPPGRVLVRASGGGDGLGRPRRAGPAGVCL